MTLWYSLQSRRSAMPNFLHAQTKIQILSVFFTQSLWIPCLVLLSCLPPPCAAELPRIQHPILKAHHAPPLSFLVFGDWGRKGFYNQSQVAQQMGIVGEELDIDFVISTGDNFYDDGLTGVRDPAFFQSFTNIYTAPSLHKPWYSVLGNHDYRGDAKAQLSRALRKRDRRWLCMRSFILQTGLVDFFFVDTTPMVDKYFQEIGKHTYDWRGVLPRNKYIQRVLKDVDSALRYSRGKWKIVVGHHTIKSAGHHGVTSELVHLLLPILQKNKVDFYFNGHDHCLERISDNKSGIEFITSGGGSKAWKGDVKAWNPPEELKMYHDGQGFVSMDITNRTANLKFYDVFGHVLHQFTTFKQLHSDSPI